ncbi:MAG: hypothetical protein QG602_955 [Verrucomicrobiota bacterium]|nr:hypothetical protein [Verrucomicrobiota bacterium]
MKLPSLLLVFSVLAAVVSAAPAKLVSSGPDGRLSYAPYNAAGDTILDFSHCGYGGGGVALPHAFEKLRLRANETGDDTARIQAALDEVARLPLGADGLRGAVVLQRGVYRVEGTLRIGASGVVLRGEGQGETDTVIIATGKKQRVLVEVMGGAAPDRATARAVRITDVYVPVGARSFRVADASGLKVGETVFVDRLGNAAWIAELDMDHIPPDSDGTPSTQWSPFTLAFDRVITAIDGHRVTVDAPLACSIDERWGGGQLVPYADPARITNTGVENLRAVSVFDAAVQEKYRDKFTYAADEAHAFHAVSFNHAKNCWARDITAVNFYHGVSLIQPGAKWITVQDSRSLAPVSKITGGRRYPFHIGGQLSLVLRCYSEGARHAFVVSSRVPGPNAFVFGVSREEFGHSEPHHRWSTGGLYDNIESDIAFQDRSSMGSGHGWAGANYVAWNTRGSLTVQQPPTAQNFSFGHLGKRNAGAFPRPQGHWESFGQPVAPRSLYFTQLRDRLGPPAPLVQVIDGALQHAARQYEFMLREIEGQPGLPRSVENSARKMSERDWTIGFFPGSLWYLFEATGDAMWRDAAQRYTARTESFQHNRGTHDVGFVLYCSYGNGLRLTGEEAYRSVLLTGAASLATRFSPVVGAIKSWDRPGRWDFPVIVDNMMNLELLLWAAQTDPRYRDIALKHADTTLREIIRPDGSQFHVVEFDSATGKVKQKFTHQGAADDSVWSRGQAWATYGYTMMFRFTRDPRYLKQARACADYVLSHPNLPEDKVPYWDFNAPQIPATARDSSASALMASALYELADYSGPDGVRYAAFAEEVLRSLATPAYLAPVGSNYGFLLAHATGSYRAHLEVDVPLIYGDYYFLEALLRARARLK